MGSGVLPLSSVLPGHQGTLSDPPALPPCIPLLQQLLQSCNTGIRTAWKGHLGSVQQERRAGPAAPHPGWAIPARGMMLGKEQGPAPAPHWGILFAITGTGLSAHRVKHEVFGWDGGIWEGNGAAGFLPPWSLRARGKLQQHWQELKASLGLGAKMIKELFLACASEGPGHRRLVPLLHDGSWKEQRAEHSTPFLDEDFLKVWLNPLLFQFPLR